MEIQKIQFNEIKPSDDLRAEEWQLSEETTIKKVIFIQDSGWDDELFISLDNGIFLECKYFQDPGFYNGEKVKLVFNDDQSQLTVHTGDHSLKFRYMDCKHYRAF